MQICHQKEIHHIKKGESLQKSDSTDLFQSNLYLNKEKRKKIILEHKYNLCDCQKDIFNRPYNPQSQRISNSAANIRNVPNVFQSANTIDFQKWNIRDTKQPQYHDKIGISRTLTNQDLKQKDFTKSLYQSDFRQKSIMTVQQRTIREKEKLKKLAPKVTFQIVPSSKEVQDNQKNIMKKGFMTEYKTAFKQPEQDNDDLSESSLSSLDSDIPHNNKNRVAKKKKTKSGILLNPLKQKPQ